MYTEKEIKLIEKNCETISEHKLYEIYDETLDECHEEVEICGMFYSTSRVFKLVDKIAYDCGFNDYIDNDYQEINGDYYLKSDVDYALNKNL